MKREFLPRGSNALDIYRSEMKRFPLLTVEEEQSLARIRRRDGDASSNRLVTANLRFVVKVAYEYRSCGLSMADLIQEGNIGLMKAVQKFDPDRNTRLISYAVSWIRAYIQNYIMKSFSLVKLGTTQAQRKLFFSLARTKRELDGRSALHGVDSDGEDSSKIARTLDVKPSEVEEMSQRMVARDFSLDASVGHDGLTTHLDLLVDQRPAQDEELSAAQEREMVQGSVREALARLDRRERYIVEQRVMSDDPMSLRDIGGQLSVSAERARQLELRATLKLKRDLDQLSPQTFDWTPDEQVPRREESAPTAAAYRSARRARKPGKPPATRSAIRYAAREASAKMALPGSSRGRGAAAVSAAPSASSNISKISPTLGSARTDRSGMRVTLWPV